MATKTTNEFLGTGRRKTSIARVRIATGSGKIVVNGRLEDTNDQLFWAGISGVVLLPSTVTPLGLNKAGLPLGVQIIGDHLQDLTTIEMARLVVEQIGGFVPPPGY